MSESLVSYEKLGLNTVIVRLDLDDFSYIASYIKKHFLNSCIKSNPVNCLQLVM